MEKLRLIVVLVLSISAVACDVNDPFGSNAAVLQAHKRLEDQLDSLYHEFDWRMERISEIRSHKIIGQELFRSAVLEEEKLISLKVKIHEVHREMARDTNSSGPAVKVSDIGNYNRQVPSGVDNYYFVQTAVFDVVFDKHRNISDKEISCWAQDKPCMLGFTPEDAPAYSPLIEEMPGCSCYLVWWPVLVSGERSTHEERFAQCFVAYRGYGEDKEHERDWEVSVTYFPEK